MDITTKDLVSKLSAARRSHCRDCGCNRCHRIDQLLEELGLPSHQHSEETRAWLIEGRLMQDEIGAWSIQIGDIQTPLDDLLFPWAGYQVAILIGNEIPKV